MLLGSQRDALSLEGGPPSGARSQSDLSPGLKTPLDLNCPKFARMEQIWSDVLREVALEGPWGCTLTELWELIHLAPPSEGGHLQKACVFQGRDRVYLPLRQVHGSKPTSQLILTQIFPCRPLPLLSDETSSQVKKKRTRTPVAVEGPTPVDSSALTSHQEAESRQVVVRALPHIQQSTFGIYDCTLSRFQLSEDHMKCLYLVARSRASGIMQSEGAKKLQVAHKNFFYIVKNLEERRLIVRTPVMIPNGSKQMTLTNILHLVRFAPEVKLRPNQYLRVLLTDQGAAIDPTMRTYDVCDDNRELKQICDKIAKASNCVVLESGENTLNHVDSAPLSLLPEFKID